MRIHTYALSSAFTVVCALGLAGPAPADEHATPDREAVIRVISEAYVDGIHNYRDPVAIRSGFHPDFEMLVLRDGKLEKLPLARWISGIEERNVREAPPAPGSPRTTTAEVPLVEITGDAAACKVELTRAGKHVFTDYLLLYRFEDGWKIVGKSFYRHP